MGLIYHVYGKGCDCVRCIMLPAGDQVKWLNGEVEQGLPYDVLITHADGRCGLASF